MARRRRMSRQLFLLSLLAWVGVLGGVIWVVFRYWYYFVAGLGVLVAAVLGFLGIKLYLDRKKDRERLEAQAAAATREQKALQKAQLARQEALAKQHATIQKFVSQIQKQRKKVEKTTATLDSFTFLDEIEEKIADIEREFDVQTKRSPSTGSLSESARSQPLRFTEAVDEVRKVVTRLREELAEEVASPHIYVWRRLMQEEPDLNSRYRLYFDLKLIRELKLNHDEELPVVDVRINKKKYLNEYGAEFLDALILSFHLVLTEVYESASTQVNVFVDYVDESTGNDGVKCVATSRASREFIEQINPPKVNPRKALAKCETQTLTKFQILAPNEKAVLPQLTFNL